MYLTLFHKMLVLLVIINVITVIYWNQRTKERDRLSKLESERKRWLEKETRNLYRIVVTTTDEVLIGEPQLPKCVVTSRYSDSLPVLEKSTSLSIAQRLVDHFMTAGYFTIGNITVPSHLIEKVQVVGVVTMHEGKKA